MSTKLSKMEKTSEPLTVLARTDYSNAAKNIQNTRGKMTNLIIYSHGLSSQTVC